MHQRIGMDDLYTMCKPEPQPHVIIDSQIGKRADPLYTSRMERLLSLVVTL
jgi:hypothetical protein